MTRHDLRCVVGVFAVVAMLLPGSALGADYNGWVGPYPPMSGTMAIATGSDANVDGYLSIGPDDYGAWASTGFGGGGDNFNPAGGNAGMEVTFTSGLFLFTGDGGRELLSDSTDWQAVFGPDATLNRTVTGGLVGSDTNGDGIQDTLTSGFNVAGGATNLDFQLTQHVATFASGISFMQQDYVITNNGGATSLELVRAFDADMLWSGDFADDEVGTSMHPFDSDLGYYVFQQEVGDGSTAMTLSSQDFSIYYGGKNGVEPGGGPPAYGFGTDVQVWDAFGVPTSWINHIANVGYDTNGVSGPGTGATPDGFVGMSTGLFEIGQGEEVAVSLLYTYGQNSPVPEPATISLLAMGLLLLKKRRQA